MLAELQAHILGIKLLKSGHSLTGWKRPFPPGPRNRKENTIPLLQDRESHSQATESNCWRVLIDGSDLDPVIRIHFMKQLAGTDEGIPYSTLEKREENLPVVFSAAGSLPCSNIIMQLSKNKSLQLSGKKAPFILTSRSRKILQFLQKLLNLHRHNLFQSRCLKLLINNLQKVHTLTVIIPHFWKG